MTTCIDLHWDSWKHLTLQFWKHKKVAAHQFSCLTNLALHDDTSSSDGKHRQVQNKVSPPPQNMKSSLFLLCQLYFQEADLSPCQISFFPVRLLIVCFSVTLLFRTQKSHKQSLCQSVSYFCLFLFYCLLSPSHFNVNILIILHVMYMYNMNI